MKKPKSYDKAENEAIHLMEYADGNRVSFISLLSLVSVNQSISALKHLGASFLHPIAGNHKIWDNRDWC